MDFNALQAGNALPTTLADALSAQGAAPQKPDTGLEERQALFKSWMSRLSSGTGPGTGDGDAARAALDRAFDRAQAARDAAGQAADRQSAARANRTAADDRSWARTNSTYHASEFARAERLAPPRRDADDGAIDDDRVAINSQRTERAPAPTEAGARDDGPSERSGEKRPSEVGSDAPTGKPARQTDKAERRDAARDDTSSDAATDDETTVDESAGRAAEANASGERGGEDATENTQASTDGGADDTTQGDETPVLIAADADGQAPVAETDEGSGDSALAAAADASTAGDSTAGGATTADGEVGDEGAATTDGVVNAAPTTPVDGDASKTAGDRAEEGAPPAANGRAGADGASAPVEGASAADDGGVMTTDSDAVLVTLDATGEGAVEAAGQASVEAVAEGDTESGAASVDDVDGGANVKTATGGGNDVKAAKTASAGAAPGGGVVANDPTGMPGDDGVDLSGLTAPADDATSDDALKALADDAAQTADGDTQPVNGREAALAAAANTKRPDQTQQTVNPATQPRQGGVEAAIDAATGGGAGQDAGAGGERRGGALGLTARLAATAPTADAAPVSDAPTNRFEAFLSLAGEGGGTAQSTPVGAMAHARHAAARHNMPGGVLDQVTVQIQKNAKTGNEKFTITLNPEELGKVDVRMEVAADGKVHAHIAVERAQTLELLQRDQRSLEKALRDAGLNADEGSLSFSLREEGTPSDRQDGFGGDGRRRGRANRMAEDEAPVIENRRYVLNIEAGRVDIQA